MPPTKKKPVKKRRKRKRHYITGTHHSPKCPTPINYRSGWEYTVALYLDQDPNVVSYEYESINIRYAIAGRYRTYTPDFLILYKDGKKVIAEIVATRKWLKENKLEDYDYQFWTNAVVEGFRKYLEVKAK